MKIRLEYIKTDKDRLIARIVSNSVRRNGSRKEKTELLSIKTTTTVEG